MKPVGRGRTARLQTGRLRVVYLDHVAQLSGGELALLRTLPALLKEVEPIVVLGEDGPLRAKLEALGIDVRVVPLAGSVRNTRRHTATQLSPGQLLTIAHYLLTLRALLRELAPDLVHTNSLKAALYGGAAGRLARVPVLWHVRDRIADDYLPRPVVRLVRLAAKVLPTAIVANSRATLATLPRGGTVLASPVVPDSVAVPAVVRSTPTGRFTVGLVGRLSPWKGQDVFLRAFALAFPGGGERAHLVGSAMFGEQDWEAELRALAGSLGIADRVDFRGFHEDVWEELALLDVAVHASTTPEPFGQVVLEAMAAGVPIIASAEGGPAEVVTDGVDGLLVAPRDPAALAAALRRLAADPSLCSALVGAGRLTAQQYRPERTAEGLLVIYRSMGSR